MPAVGEMPLTDLELHALVRIADPNARQIVARAALAQDLSARQLSVLRHTYPAWDITYERDASGHMWWIAKLRRPFTLELATAGVMSPVRREDAIALASTLAWQSALVHSVPGSS